MFEVLERRRVRVSCLDEHVTLLTDCRCAVRIGQLCSENTGSWEGFLSRLHVATADGVLGHGIQMLTAAGKQSTSASLWIQQKTFSV